MRRPIRVCAYCGGTLLADDYINQPAWRMDKALRFHGSQSCSSRHNAIEAAAAELALLLDGHEAAVAGVACSAPPLLWFEEEPPLVFCARHGLTTLAQRLLDTQLHLRDGSTSIEHVGLDGVNALHLAAASDRSLPLLRALLRAKANPCALTCDGASVCGGRTALHCAASSGACDAARLLAEL